MFYANAIRLLDGVMMSKKVKSIENEINEFSELWGADEMLSFIQDTAEIIQIYNITDKAEIENEYNIGVRVVRTVYHLSYLAEKYSGIMALIKAKHPKFYERIEKAAYAEQDCIKK